MEVCHLICLPETLQLAQLCLGGLQALPCLQAEATCAPRQRGRTAGPRFTVPGLRGSTRNVPCARAPKRPWGRAQSCTADLPFSPEPASLPRSQSAPHLKALPASSCPCPLIFHRCDDQYTSCICLLLCRGPRIGFRDDITHSLAGKGTPSQVACGLWIIPDTNEWLRANNFNGVDLEDCPRERDALTSVVI